MPVNWKTRLLSKKTIANDIVEIRLEKPAGFSYAAGQFVQFEIPDAGPDASVGASKFVLRAYSVASHPGENSLEFCMKMLPGGRASAFFANATPDTPILFQGPNGKFTCSARDEALACVATGAGLAPIWGILSDELINKKNIQPIRLIFGVRGEGDVFWADRLDALRKQFSNFSYTLSLSQPEHGWQGPSGRVTEHLNTLSPRGRFFLCGSADMVKEVRAGLLAKDTPPANIHFEIF
jgi:ferredoxin-NADP reductase